MSRDTDVQYLLDRLAIQDLATRYVRAIDRHDRALLLSLYHEDAIDRHGTLFEGGPVAYADWLPQIMDGFELTSHHLTTMNFHVAGDVGEGELYFVAYHRTHAPDAQEVLVSGRYLDRYERRQGVWKIAQRQLVWDSFGSFALTAEMRKQLDQLGVLSKPTDDISSRVLPALAQSAEAR